MYRLARIDFLQHHSRAFRRAILTAGSNLHQPHCDHALRFNTELRRIVFTCVCCAAAR
jgi:hypothetical protein